MSCVNHNNLIRLKIAMMSVICFFIDSCAVSYHYPEYLTCIKFTLPSNSQSIYFTLSTIIITKLHAYVPLHTNTVNNAPEIVNELAFSTNLNLCPPTHKIMSQ